jgi:hypothetical protein
MSVKGSVLYTHNLNKQLELGNENEAACPSSCEREVKYTEPTHLITLKDLALLNYLEVYRSGKHLALVGSTWKEIREPGRLGSGMVIALVRLPQIDASSKRILAISFVSTRRTGEMLRLQSSARL